METQQVQNQVSRLVSQSITNRKVQMGLVDSIQQTHLTKARNDMKPSLSAAQVAKLSRIYADFSHGKVCVDVGQKASFS